MSRNRKKRWKPRKPSSANKAKILIALQSAINSGNLSGKDVSAALSLLGKLKRNGSLSPRQWGYAKGISARGGKFPKTSKPQFLYAITDGDMIKLGMSRNVEKRRANLQSSNPKELFVLWEQYVGICSDKAKRAESQLHKKCRNFHIRGEWFKSTCFPLVRSFKYEDDNISEQKENEAELEIVQEANRRI